MTTIDSMANQITSKNQLKYETYSNFQTNNDQVQRQNNNINTEKVNKTETKNNVIDYNSEDANEQIASALENYEDNIAPKIEETQQNKQDYLTLKATLEVSSEISSNSYNEATNYYDDFYTTPREEYREESLASTVTTALGMEGYYALTAYNTEDEEDSSYYSSFEIAV